MNREEAQRRIKETPEFIVGPCSWCGARTIQEGGKLCRAQVGLDGEYFCGTPEEGNLSDAETGPLYQRNPDYDQLAGYLWGWFAVDEGVTKNPPEWPESPQLIDV